MINNIGLLHYLSQETYKGICEKLNLDDTDSKTGGNSISIPDNPVFHIKLYNIIYKQFGHIWFMETYLNFPKFGCSNENFGKNLFKQYGKLFGKDIMVNFPELEKIVCVYIEFLNEFNIHNADEIERKAIKSGCLPVPSVFDIDNLKHRDKSHSNIHLYISKIGNEKIGTLTLGFGSALKKRISDKIYHGPVGIKIPKMLDKQTETGIVNWALKKNNLELELKT